MKRTNKLFVIFAVAIMLVAATNAEAYTEYWGDGTAIGWGMGSIIFNGTVYFLSGGAPTGYITATTNGSIDVFDSDIFGWKVVYTAVVLGGGGETVYLDTLIFTGNDNTSYGNSSKVTGSKTTGQTGVHYGSGYWYAEVRRSIDNSTFDCYGSWNSTQGNGGFYYGVSPYWVATGQIIANTSGKTLTGSGGGTVPLHHTTS